MRSNDALRNGLREGKGLLPMKALGLLLIWAVSWLPAGAHDRSPASNKGRRTVGHRATAAIDRPAGRLPLGRPAGEVAGSLLWDGEDSLDGDPVDVLDTG